MSSIIPTRWPSCRLATTEPHNLHLPYGTDSYEADAIGDRICEAAHERGRVVLLPTIPYGTQSNQMAFPLAMNVNPSTLFTVVTDLIDSLAQTKYARCCCSTAMAATISNRYCASCIGRTPAPTCSCATGTRCC